MTDESYIEETRRGRRYSEVRKSLHEIENLADAASVKVDDSFDPSFEGIATLATELRREIDEADIEVAEDV